MRTESGRRDRLEWRPGGVAALVVATAAFLVFRHTLGHEFVNWDDDVYVVTNPSLTLPATQAIGWIFSRFYYYAYIPVTLLSHWLDFQVWGKNPQGHHLANVLLHAANSAWVLVLCRLALRGGNGARAATPAHAALLGTALAALLFAVHPLRAESVSWVSDRKDLLCAFFFLPGVAAYLRAPTEDARRRGWLLASFTLFLLAVLSKSMAVVFPVVLLLLDWLRGRLDRSALIEKIPFFAVSIAIATLSLAFTQHASKLPYMVSSLTGLEPYLFPFHVLTFPLWKTIAPVDLGPIYPRPEVAWMLAGCAMACAITWIAIRLATKGRKAPLVAWLAYLALLIPNVVGLSSGMQPLADRYSYLSTVPLYVLLGGGFGRLWQSMGTMRRIALALAGGVVATVLIAITIPQAARWRSSIALWESVATTHPVRRDYSDAYLNLAAAYAQADRNDDAAAVLEKAAAVDPGNAEVRHNLGIVCYRRHDLDRALEHLARAIELDPRDATAYYYRALVTAELGRNEESIASMVRGARLGSKEAREALASHHMSW